jgi:hypothetical protein
LFLFNCNQTIDNVTRKQAAGTINVPSLYRLVHPKPNTTSSLLSASATTASRPYQADLFGAPVVDLAAERSYRHGLVPLDVAALVRAEMRARGVTQDELATIIGISQPQLANALGRRFGLSPEPAARLREWLRMAA